MMPLVTRNHVTESSNAMITETPATIAVQNATSSLAV